MTTTEPFPATPDVRPVIVGAGPAGLTAAYMLSKRGVTCEVFELDDVVGGISRTVERDGWRFDIGGHRFFTKVTPVDDLWFEILGEENFLRRPRMSRIFYEGKFYDYPLVPMNALRNLGLVEATKCVGSYVWVRIKRPKDQTNLEGFYAARFGWRLYRTFFKTYTEKVWGVPVTELQADWGAQRIKNLSLFRAGWEAIKPKGLRRRQDKSKQVTSLIEEFNYPKFGPGMMWERCAEIVTERGSTVHMETQVTRIRHEAGRAVSATVVANGAQRTVPCTHLVSTMPMSELLGAMDPPAPAEVVAAAADLRYRDFMTVALVVPEADGFPDNWIYIHDPQVRVGRVQNFGVWSPFMVKEGRTCLGLEFFVSEGDDMWTKADADLIEQGKRELEHLGLAKGGDVEAGYVVRVKKAYPVYDAAYKANVDVMRSWIAEHCPNVYPVGRNGMHKYNNQDHSMYTAMLSVENMFGATHDVWSVNVEEEYHETSGSAGGGERGTGRDAPLLPRPASSG
ncbi:MAG: NAD(P)/FAD-dependent oxidoreductase [Actinomycetes bacterium]